MDKKHMKKLGEKLEEQMSLNDWAVWIAKSFSGCETIREYLSKAYQNPGLKHTDFYRPQKAFERQGENSGDSFEKYRSLAFDCRMRTQLAMEVNSYLEDFFSSQRDKLLLRMTQHELILAKQEILWLRPLRNGESIKYGLKCELASLYGQYDEFVLPTLEAFSEITAMYKDEFFGGSSFLVHGNQMNLEGFAHIVKAFRDSVGEGDSEFEPMPADAYLRRKNMIRDRYYTKWSAEARAHARAYIYGDDEDQISLMQQSLADSTEIPIFIPNASE